jgi:hypothetical protein
MARGKVNWHGKISYGNCFINGLIFRLTYGKGKLKLVRREDNRNVPHLIIDFDDHFWHFKCLKEIFPWPFSYVFFKGRYERKYK